MTYETSFTIRGATDVIQQRDQVLRLPRKMTHIIDPPLARVGSYGGYNLGYKKLCKLYFPILISKL